MGEAQKKNGFVKQFSLYPNDYVRIYTKNKIVEGYYTKYDIANGSIALIGHDKVDKKNIDRVSGGAITSIERYDISVLGDNYRWI